MKIVEAAFSVFFAAATAITALIFGVFEIIFTLIYGQGRCFTAWIGHEKKFSLLA